MALLLRLTDSKIKIKYIQKKKYMKLGFWNWTTFFCDSVYLNFLCLLMFLHSVLFLFGFGVDTSSSLSTMGLDSGPGSAHSKSVWSSAQKGRIFSKRYSFLFHVKPSGTIDGGKSLGGSISEVISILVFGPSYIFWQVILPLSDGSLLNSKWL